MKKTVLLLIIILFIGLLFFLWRGLQGNPNLLPSALIDKPVPHFELPLLSDENKTFDSRIFNGQISLLNVWASWCPSCRLERDVWGSIVEKEDILLYGLNYKDTREAAFASLDQYGNPFAEIAFDSRGLIGIELGVYGTPETFIIDREGIIRYRHVGPITPTLWKDVLKPILEKIN